MTIASLDSGRLVSATSDAIVTGSRSETVAWAVQLPANAALTDLRLRIASPTRADQQRVKVDDGSVGQVRPVHVDLNRAGYIRQSGLAAEGPAALPRAVIPLAKASDGSTPLAACAPTPELAATVLWIDLPIPPDAPAGDFLGAVELVNGLNQIVGRVPLRLTVHDLTLPVERALRVVGKVSWASLQQNFPDDFEAVTAHLVSRSDPRFARAVGVLDGLVQLAQQHRLSIYVDRIQPIAKWSPRPTVLWDDFDGIVGPWLDGSAFADKEPLGLWPLPGVDPLHSYPASAQRAYYEQAALHFDAKNWLSRAPVWLENDTNADILTGPAKRRLLERAGLVLSAHPRVRASLPLPTDQLEFAEQSSSGATLPRQADEDRLLTASPGLIFNTPIQTAVAANRRSPTFLRTDLAGLLPYAGTGGDERDVRATAWLAFTRGATILPFDDVLPAQPFADAPADPNELVWFYPGELFGVKGPVPSLQLKWLRRAEQDYEYLQLARARGQVSYAQVIARLLTKSVQIPPGQRADPIYALMTGTAEQKAWDSGMDLLTKTILLRKPGEAADEQAQINWNIEATAWVIPQEKPLLVGRTSLFSPGENGSVDVRLGVDLYNASDTTPAGNTLGYEGVPRGWTVEPEPVAIGQLATYQVQRAGLRATINPDVIDPRTRADVNLTFIDGNYRRPTPATLVVPAALTRRHEGGLQINGSLDDWTDDDALHLGPLVRMLDRPTLQQHTIATAPTASSVYSAFSADNLYVAFKVGGLASVNGNVLSAGNFVTYDFRRAWGEDLVELLVQAVYADGSLGPVLHIACKPNGGQWAERKLDLRANADANESWEPLETGTRYKCTVDPTNDAWRGELAIPWRAIHPPGFADAGKLPTLLRFNVVQHQHKTGISATWAGPIDHGRDDLLTGVLVLRDEPAR